MRIGTVHNRTVTKEMVTVDWISQEYPLDAVVNDVQGYLASDPNGIQGQIDAQSGNIDPWRITQQSNVNQDIANHQTWPWH